MNKVLGFVRCTAYYLQGDSGNDVGPNSGWATDDNPMWFMLDHDGYEFVDEIYLCGGASAGINSNRVLSIMRTDDYTVVPLDDLPDEVCVALAKRALIEGDET